MLLILVSSCQDDDKKFGDIVTPTNLTLSYDIVGKDGDHPDGDGSGKVALTAHADNATSYKYFFSDESEQNAPTGIFTKQFTKTGVNTYTVTVVAYGTGGNSTSTSTEVTVLSTFEDPEALQFLTNGTSKKWYWMASKKGHLGVGPNNDDIEKNFIPDYYGAAAYEKIGGVSSCLYKEELVFTKDGDNIKFKINTDGGVFFNASYNSVGGSGDTSQDLCQEFAPATETKNVSLGPASSKVAPENTRGTAMTFSDGGFMGYYVGATTYEILKITDTELYVRCVMGSDPSLAWYHIFTTKTLAEQQSGGSTDYTNLKFSDDFDVDGAPDATKWTAETGNGTNGWGNNELQFYRAENAVVAGGVLKITAKKESGFGTQDYTSARLTTHNKFDFTYGKVEIKAKLPSGGGTWPALWMLGSNYVENPWPGCGEIDIMEHVGNNQNHVLGTLHLPGNSGGNGISGNTTVPGLSEAFHIYTLVWSPTKISWAIDGTIFFSYDNTAATPFNKDFFMILNVAMGGNLGGAVDPAFTSSSMEVDYVKIYQ